jgi:hypothetical protein
MTKKQPPKNSMSVQMLIFDEDEDGSVMSIGVAHNLSDDMPEDEQTFYLDALSGLVSYLNTSMESLAFTGMLLREIAEYEEDEEGGIEFEPAQELLEAVENGKVIQLKKKLH